MDTKWKDMSTKQLEQLLRGWENEVAHIKNCYGCVCTILKEKKDGV